MSLYVKLETQLLLDSRFVQAGPEAFALYVKGLLWSKEQMTDGSVPAAVLPLIGLGLADPAAAAERLLQAGAWTRTDDGFTIGFGEWARTQTTADQVEAKRVAEAERKRVQRERKKPSVPEASGDCPRTNADVPNTSRDCPAGTAEDVPVMSQDCPSGTPGLKPELRAQSSEPYSPQSPPPPDGLASELADEEAREPEVQPPGWWAERYGGAWPSFDAWWGDFLRAYPPRLGDRKAATGEVVAKRLLKAGRGDLPDRILAGAVRYRRFMEACGKSRTEYVQQMSTWLRGEAWNEPWDPPEKPEVKRFQTHLAAIEEVLGS